MDFSNDEEGKKFFSSYLESKGLKVLNLGTQFSSYDIEAEDNDGNHYFFELKLRPIDSKKWGDTIIEKKKYDALDSLDGEEVVVNFFTDCFHVFPLHAEHEEQRHYCQKTNNWDTHKVPKILVSYKNTEKSRREYPN